MKPLSSVLIVEDNDQALEFLVTLLTMHGVGRVVGVSSAEQALAILAAESFEAVVCDYRLEGMHGLELVAALRRRGDRTAVLLITGDLNQRLTMQAAKYERVAALSKPVQMAQLCAALARVSQPAPSETPRDRTATFRPSPNA